MKYFSLLLFCSLFMFVVSQTITNIRLVDHTSYITELIQRTVSLAEKNNWSSLKVHDVTMVIEEEILNKTMTGTVEFKNGFIVSMQYLDIVPHTIQQVWLYTRSTNITNLELRSTMRMHDVMIGYDIDGIIDGKKYHNTGTILYPLIQFQTALIRNLYTNEMSSTVVPVLQQTTNRMKFLPEDDVTQVLSQLYNWNSTFPSVHTWANEVFAPIILNLGVTVLPIPPYCYDCPVQ